MEMTDICGKCGKKIGKTIGSCEACAREDCPIPAWQALSSITLQPGKSYCDKHKLIYPGDSPCSMCDVDRAPAPTPGHTDFKTWERATLERFARDAADEAASLKTELAFTLAAWRKEVLRSAAQAVSCGTQPQGEQP